MSIRLNKVTKECNVGLQTAVEFLQKKGFTDIEVNPNTKITDEQYAMLVSEFKTDKGLRSDANLISSQRQNKAKKPTVQVEEKTAAPVEIPTRTPQAPRPKVVGKVDLDNLRNGRPAQPAQKPAPAPAPAPAEKPAPQAAPAPEAPKPAPAPAVESAAEAQPAPAAPASSGKPAVGKEVDGVFRLAPSASAMPGLTVKGRIDLDSLNQSTRPKKKSKEERRREREEKGRVANGATQQGGNGERKKRARIGERVDVGAVSSAASPRKGGGNGQQQPRSAAPAAGRGKNRKNHPAAPAPKPEVTDEDVARQVKETLARLTGKTKAGKGAKYRKEKRDSIRAGLEEQMEAREAESKVLKLTEFVTANELASMMNVPVTGVIGTCMSIGIMVSINQRLDAETINLVAEEYGFRTEYVSAEVSEAVNEEPDNEEDLLPRAPIVTVMGHVDHGKTSLLDYIRKTNVIAGEAGGITQHIGAYNVGLEDGRHITFLDTPGHEAFTAMRARGAQVTDIAIIIVAADDDIMPQTKEAINHAQAAGVPIVFAINKIDKPAANPDKIKEGLAAMNFLVEEWGGKYQSQDISAKQGIGVAELMEKVLLEAEMLELKANPNRRATGSIIESSLDKGRGYVATLLVSGGTLRIGDVLLAGTHHGRVKAMFNERGQRITEIGPAQAATVLGLNGAPTAGDTFHVMETEQEAREIAGKREQLQREQGLRTQKMLTLDEVGRRIALGGFQELKVIVKGDVDGSIEALSDSLIKLSTEKIAVTVIHKAVGQISESDVALAAASEAIIIGFQVRPSAMARKAAEAQGVDIRLYSIIYDAIEEVTAAMEGMLAPELKEEVTATIEVRQVYHISKVGTVAGAYVMDGKVQRSNKARLIRDGIVVHTGQILALKRFKDDVKEVGTNFECGISLVNYNDLREGDTIETFQEIEVKAKL